jgi:hypothetical protein
MGFVFEAYRRTHLNLSTGRSAKNRAPQIDGCQQSSEARMSAISYLLCKPRVLGFTNTKHNELGRSRRFVECHSDPCSETFRTPLHSRSALLTIILSLSVLSAASIAIAQPLLRDFNELEPALIPTENYSGWWSPELAESQAPPRLLVMASANIGTDEPFGPSNLSNSKTERDPRADGISKHPAENCTVEPALLPSIYTSATGIAAVRVLNTGAGTVVKGPWSFNYSLIAKLSRLPTDDFSLSGPLSDAIQPDRISWEQALADSTTITDERGGHFSPLLEIDFDRARFPILLYVPPMRDTTQDAR